MEIFKVITGYILMVSGLLLIRSQGLEYSHKKAIGLLLALAGIIILFMVAWWHVIIGSFLCAIIAVASGKKAGIEKEIERKFENRIK